jgi:hypothetical protein
MGCRDCCTCTKTVQGILRFLVYFTFLITVLSMSVVGWSRKCEPCAVSSPTSPYIGENGKYYCHYLGLFEWCDSSEGRQTCYDCKFACVFRARGVLGLLAALCLALRFARPCGCLSAFLLCFFNDSRCALFTPVVFAVNPRTLYNKSLVSRGYYAAGK